MYTSLTIMNIILEGKFCFTETEWICKTSLFSYSFIQPLAFQSKSGKTIKRLSNLIQINNQYYKSN